MKHNSVGQPEYTLYKPRKWYKVQYRGVSLLNKNLSEREILLYKYRNKPSALN
jgi:hypothetical protein